MHKCAAKCCENDQASMEATHECISNCSTKLNSAQSYVERELTGFQVILLLNCYYIPINESFYFQGQIGALCFAMSG